MNTAQTKQFSDILGFLAQELDIPQVLRQKAIAKYNHLAAWIKEDNQERFRTDSEIYSQGSMRLGTVIRPVKSEDDYDIDLVYRRDIARSSMTQKELMTSAGEQINRYIQHLKLAGEDVPVLEPGKRCWTLKYQDRFHMDVLPAIPDDKAAENNVRDLQDAILITDKELYSWQCSNPRGYANWFNEQQILDLQESRLVTAKAANVDVEDVPINMVNTPLRQAVKLLKRHRDIRYQGNPDDKPISIIITTLAARSYKDNQRANLYETTVSIVQNMRNYIEVREGVRWVPNPVNPENENFADKWKKHPERETRFYEWLEQVEIDICQAMKGKGIDRIVESLKPVFGEAVTTKAFSQYGESLYQQRESGKLRMETGTGILGTTGTIPVKGHTFFGLKNTG